MQLDELIETHSIEAVSKRTNITTEVISRLLNKEFSALKKTQALGAISIIEREYDVDLGVLRQECKAYFGDTDEDGGLTVVKPISSERRFFSKLFSLALLLLLAFGAWYFFTEYYHQKIHPFSRGETNILDSVLVKEKGRSAEDLNGSTVERNVTTVKKSDSEDMKRIPEEKSGASAERSEEKKDTANDRSEANSSSAGLTGEESGKLSDQASGPEQNRTLEVAPAAKRESITLLPMKTMWFRLIDYETKKARTFKRRERYEIDLKGHRWLFATENAKFAIIDGDLLEEYEGKKKLFFLFDQSGVHQLSEKAYRAVEK